MGQYCQSNWIEMVLAKAILSSRGHPSEAGRGCTLVRAMYQRLLHHTAYVEFDSGSHMLVYSWLLFQVYCLIKSWNQIGDISNPLTPRERVKTGPWMHPRKTFREWAGVTAMQETGAPGPCTSMTKRSTAGKSRASWRNKPRYIRVISIHMDLYNLATNNRD